MKYIYCIFAGACDATTGILLMVAPEFTLRLMQIHSAPTEPVYMRWIGAFVFSIGSSYFLPFLRRDDARFAFMLEMTTWVRVVICAFVTGGILSHALSSMWFVVAATDGALACIQFVMLKRGVFAHVA